MQKRKNVKKHKKAQKVQKYRLVLVQEIKIIIMQKPNNKKCTFVPAISTSYLFTYLQ